MFDSFARDLRFFRRGLAFRLVAWVVVKGLPMVVSAERKRTGGALGGALEVVSSVYRSARLGLTAVLAVLAVLAMAQVVLMVGWVILVVVRAAVAASEIHRCRRIRTASDIHRHRHRHPLSTP